VAGYGVNQEALDGGLRKKESQMVGAILPLQFCPYSVMAPDHRIAPVCHLLNAASEHLDNLTASCLTFWNLFYYGAYHTG
jgi:hypothetical protein